MKLFLYKLIFPHINQLYVGIASSKSRYSSIPNSEFTQRSHHNKYVNKLLRNNEFCYWHIVKEFETYDDLLKAEETYLQKVWKSGNFLDRPNWLLNSTNQSSGRAAGWKQTTESKLKIGSADYTLRNYQSFRNLEARQLKTGFDFRKIWIEVELAMSSTTSYHWGGAKIAKKYNISRRTLAKMSSAIRKNISFEEWAHDES